MDKKAALQNALDMIEKQYGKGSIMKLGDDDVGKGIPTTSSGSLSLDMAL
jgi:recombination protein RecA